MTEIPRRVRRAVLLRSFLVQGSWNYQTLIGTGFAFVLVPVFRHLFGPGSESLRQAIARHAGLFNSHPYLATVAIGAIARMEAEEARPELMERFKTAVRSSLGSIGDQLVWLAWRPAVGLLGIGLLLAGAPWWAALAAFLVVYNALHLWLRVWGLRIGLRSGLQVGAVLRETPFQEWGRRAADLGAFLAGACFVLALLRIPGGAGDVALASAAAVAGFWLGLRVRNVLWAALTAVWVVGILGGIFYGSIF